MILKLPKYLRKVTNKEYVRINPRLPIFVFFVFISTIFWFLNALSKNYTTEIEYPVEYVGAPENKQLIGKDDLPAKLKITVDGYGFKLLRYDTKILNIIPITLQLSNAAIRRKSGADSTMYYLPTNSLIEDIGKQFGNELKILNISPDTLFLCFNSVIRRKIPISTENVHYDLEKQYMIKGRVTTIPDSIEVWGPASEVNKIHEIKTQTHYYTGVKTSIHQTLKLEKVAGVEYALQRVIVNIPVEEFTEMQMKLSIETINVPDTLILKTFPNEVTVSFLVGLSKYNEVTPEMFKVVADFETILENRNNVLKVRITTMPDFVKSVKFAPRNIEYIIEKNKGRILN